jgi:hypothetical protein
VRYTILLPLPPVFRSLHLIQSVSQSVSQSVHSKAHSSPTHLPNINPSHLHSIRQHFLRPLSASCVHSHCCQCDRTCSVQITQQHNFHLHSYCLMYRSSSVNIVTRPLAQQTKNRGSNATRGNEFSSQPQGQWHSKLYLQAESGRSMNLTSHPIRSQG